MHLEAELTGFRRIETAASSNGMRPQSCKVLLTQAGRLHEWVCERLLQFCDQLCENFGQPLREGLTTVDSESSVGIGLGHFRTTKTDF